MNPPQAKRWRIVRRCLVGLGVCATLAGLFYTEELWRGKRAWENCQRALAAQGIDIKWADNIPAPVPEDQNVFGVPEMQESFTGHGAKGMFKDLLSYPKSTARLTIAELTIGLPGISAPSYSGATVLQWGEPRAKEEASRLIKNALGPMVVAPAAFNIILRQPEEIRPAQIFLQCQTTPTEKELRQFLPLSIADTYVTYDEKIQVEPTGDGSYNVTMLAPVTVAEILKWNEQFAADDTLIRKALQRPYARMDGDYSEPSFIPIPNFVALRFIAQRLGAVAQCHLLLGQPEETSRDLTFLHDICRRIMEENKPMTLVSAMINVAIRGLYANTIADGLRWQAWREPQLAALQEQLKQINLLLPVQQAFEFQRECLYCDLGTTKSPAQVVKLYKSISPDKNNSWEHRKMLALAALVPRGWAYQSMVTGFNIYSNVMAGLDLAGQIVFPNKVEAIGQQVDKLFSHFSPYNFLLSIMIPNFKRAWQTTARNQTMINQALIACALERYRLAHGEYPEALDALIPQFIDAIPHDVIGGQPPHYRRAADGTFSLYSIGWNGRDNGGVPGKSNATGDWVWPEEDR